MRTTFQTLTVLISAVLFSSSSATFAGTVTTTDLPPGTSIVNIDGRADGAATFSNDVYQSYWYQPFENPAPPSLTLLPETYRFRVINPADAAALYPSLTAAQLGQVYTGWTYKSPWGTDYLVYNSSALTNPYESQLFDGAIAPGIPGNETFSSAQAAYDRIIANSCYTRFAPPRRDE
jgi:hypothetical protein